MVPTLMSGDVLLVRRFAPPTRVGADFPTADGGAGVGAVGRVVVGRFRSLPATLVVKRAAGMRGGGWVLRSDNPYAGGDSSVHGVADIEGLVVLRWRLHPGRRPAVGLPRRIATSPADRLTPDE